MMKLINYMKNCRLNILKLQINYQKLFYIFFVVFSKNRLNTSSKTQQYIKN